ncbi:hypothetical protein [Agriterribacter sp.]|uniref:hypothetical protein n=1 Tax=Agriterribacter sp. TaxID=2821509 RepID=UPI002CC7E0A2|nr:hypothetical protein [Agriterribacter sp.]HRO44316.1 hypothetical protein [Agriterribacter sp.]HRQ16632.1 hypothetical protein [Agriterribacter sp.]
MKGLRNGIKKTTATPKGKVIAAVIFLLVVVAATLAIVYWNAIKEQLIRNQVRLKVREKTDRLYHIHYNNMELDEVGGNLSVSGLSLQYDSARYLKMKETRSAPAVLFKIEIPSISVTGIQTPRALLTREITGSKIQISYPVIEMLYTHEGKDSARAVPQEEVYKQILGGLEKIKIDTLLIIGAQIITKNIRTGKQELQLMDTRVELRDVMVDSASGRDRSRIFFSKQLSASCSTLLWSSSDQLYTYKVENITMHSANRQINVERFRIIPSLGETDFAAKKNIQSDRFDTDIKQLAFHQISFQQLVQEQLMADSIVMQSASFKIYRDMTMPPDTRSKIGTYPHQKVALIPFPVDIKKIILKNTEVEYKEKGRLLQKTGKVTFGNINAVISNVTNNKSSPDKIITADIRAMFLKRFPVQTHWTFYLFNPKGRFDIRGHLGALNATAINGITESLGGARIRKGYIRDLSFNFKGDDYGMDGTVKLLYDDLRIALLKKDKETKTLEEKKLVSWGANMFIKDANPSKGEAPRVAHVHFDREINRSIFHLSWKTLSEGIKVTALPSKNKK